MVDVWGDSWGSSWGSSWAESEAAPIAAVIRTITSLRADVGLPHVANDFAYDEPGMPGYGTYFDDGTTWADAAGSVMAGQQPLPTGRTLEAPLRHRTTYKPVMSRGSLRRDY